MDQKTRKPLHPGVILDEHYIKPLNLNLQELADNLGIARNTLYKIRIGQASVTPEIAICLAEAFNTTPALWINLQKKYDLWMAKHAMPRRKVKPLYRAKEATKRCRTGHCRPRVNKAV